MYTTFTKIASYNLSPHNSKINNFEFICNVLSQKINPPSENKKILTLNNQNIMCSNLNRAKECLKNDAIFLIDLNEIPFDLNKYCTFQQWQEKGSDAVRAAFIQAFTTDELIIKRSTILNQAQKILRICSEKKYTVISHTFRLIIIKAIHETNGQIIKEPNLINNYIKTNQRILNFRESFHLEI